MKSTVCKMGLLPIALAIGAVASAASAEDRESSTDPVVFPAAETDALAASLPTPSPRPAVRFGRAVDLAGADIEPESNGLAGSVSTIGTTSVGQPLVGGRLSSRFGMRVHPMGGTRFHGGVDIAAAQGTPVFATSTGIVLSASWGGGYGILVRISHDGSMETRYAHLSAVAVRAGDAVQAGQVIGYVGSTGRSTGPHLHYETRVAGRPVDPATAW